MQQISFLRVCEEISVAVSMELSFVHLLSGGVGVPEKGVPRPTHADWISPKAWGEICRIANVSANFSSLPEDVVNNLEQWKPIFDSVSLFDAARL